MNPAVLANVFSGLLVAAGLVWVLLMVRAMLGLLRLAPRGERFRTYNQLSMWKFAAIRSQLGPPADAHLQTMRRGAYAFLAIVIAVVAVTAIAAVVTR